MVQYIPDIAIAILLIIFIGRGVKSGLVISVASVSVIILSFLGANFLNRAFAQVLVDLMAPVTENIFTTMLVGLKGLVIDFNIAHDIIIKALDTTIANPTCIIVSFVLWALSFAGLVLLFNLVFDSLDFITKLPIINLVNKLGGGVAGFIKGVLVVSIVIYVILMLGLWEYPANLQETYILRHCVWIVDLLI